MSPAYEKKDLLKSAYNYTQAGEWDRALEEYKKMTRLFPDDPNIHSMIADLLVRKKDNVSAAREYLAAARQYKDLEQSDKEMASYRKAIKALPGHDPAISGLKDFFARQLDKARKNLEQGQLDQAEELAQKLLDADPAHLGVNKFLDELKARRTVMESQKVLEEELKEQEQVEKESGNKAAGEVLKRLKSTAEKYIEIGDLDNAAETLSIMLKIDPLDQDARRLRESVQHQQELRHKAQNVWDNLQNRQVDSTRQVAKEANQIKLQEGWQEQDLELQKRLQAEKEAAVRAEAYEKEIIESAVKEIKENRQRPADTVSQEALRNSPFLAESTTDASKPDSGLQNALNEEKQARQDAEQREQVLREQITREQEKLAHAIEMARHEAEIKAKEATLVELNSVLEQERHRFQETLDQERAAMAVREENLRKQMAALMAEEMQKIKTEVTEKTLREMREKLEQEQQSRLRLEEEARQREAEALAPIQKQQQKIELALRIAEEKANKERQAIEVIKQREQDRKKAIVEEAMHRRQARETRTGERKQVIQTSKRISEVLHKAATRHIQQDTTAMLETAKNYLKQDLLLDAMRICQQIVDADPDNEKVKEILKEIYVRKGL
jgi:tetratricopeptide (TPR) repeat protein